MSDLVVVEVEDDSSDERETACTAEDRNTVALEPAAEAKERSVPALPLTMDEKSYDDNETEDTAGSNEDEEKPLLDLMKHLINYNGKQNTKLTNAQLIGILKKEFDLDVANLHFISVDIYMNVLKKFLKDWPQWDEFDQVMHETRCMNDKEEVERTLEREYHSLKDYLAAILKASQPFAREAAQKLKRSLEIPESSRALPGDVVLEINCTRNQLNTLFFRKPHPVYKSTIFNIDNELPSKICVTPLTLEVILNSCYVNISINMTCLKYKREMMTNFKHTLVNHKLQRIQREPPLNPHLQCPKNMRVDCRLVFKQDLKGVIDRIQRSNRYTMNIQPDIDCLFRVITTDFKILLENDLSIDLPCTYRHYLSRYPYVRHLYKDVDTQSEKYDLQLEEKISPMLKFHIARLNPHSSAITTELNWLKTECTICSIVFVGVTGIEALKAHFTDSHQNEPDWTCTHCDKKFSAMELATARWLHTCEEAGTENHALFS